MAGIRAMRKVWPVVIVTFFVPGCASVVTTHTQPPAGYSGPVAHRPEVQVGDVWEFDTESRGKPGRARWEVVEVKTEEILVRSIGTHHWNRDLNWFKTTNRRGDVVEEANPEIRYYNWPLYCGKSWRVNVSSSGPSGSFSYTDEFVVHCDKGNALFRVEVPAGTFEAFKISRDVIGGVTHFDAYYAPAVKAIVKWEGASAAGGPAKRVLTGYKLGPSGGKGE